MKLFDRIADRIAGAWVGYGSGLQRLNLVSTMAEFGEAEREQHRLVDSTVQETMTNLELSAEDVGWQNLSQPYAGWMINRNGLRKMIALSRIMYILNPLIKRAVTVQELYVWALGCTVRADDKDLNEVITEFLEDEKNQEVIGRSWVTRERELRIDGNVFFVLFRNMATGAVRIRTLPTDQIEDVICNPQDMQERWYYKRFAGNDRGNPGDLNYLDTGDDKGAVLYPDINYIPVGAKPATYDGIRIDWSRVILHERSGGLPNSKFGIPELFCTFNWATAYKRILENFATVLAAYARIALQIVNLGTKKDQAGAKSRLNTAMSSGTLSDTNPPPNTASIATLTGNAKIEAVKTAHSTTAPEEARALRSMVAAGSDSPEHFFGDSDIGNFATSTTLDRPTELKMVGRQGQWGNVMQRIFRYVAISSAMAPDGKLKAKGWKVTIEIDRFDYKTFKMTLTPPGDKSKTVIITFPDVLQREVTERIRAVVQAATLGGSDAEGIIPDRKLLFLLLMEALGKERAQEITDKYYPEEEYPQEWVSPKEKHELEKIKAEAAQTTALASKKKAETPAPKGPNTSTEE